MKLFTKPKKILPDKPSDQQILNEILSQLRRIALIIESESLLRSEYIRFKTESIKMDLSDRSERVNKKTVDNGY